MLRRDPRLLWIGLPVIALLVTGPAWAKDEKEKVEKEPTRRQQLQQQQPQQQRGTSSNPGQNQPRTADPPRSLNQNKPSGGSLRNQPQQNQPQPRSLPQQSGNSSNNPGQGTLRNNLQNRSGAATNDNKPPTTRGPQVLDPARGSNLGSQNRDADQQIRDRLKKQAEDLQKQPGRNPAGNQPNPGVNRDALKERIESRKPPTEKQPGGNPSSDQARDRLKAAQDQLKNRPQTDQRDRLPNQGNLGNRTPNLGDKLPNTGNRLPNVDDKRPNLNEKVPNLGDRRPNLNDKVPNVGDRRPSLNDKVPNVGGPGVGGQGRDRIDFGKTGRPTTPIKIDKNGLFGNLKDNPELKDAFDQRKLRDPKDLDRAFDKLQNVSGLQNQLKQSNLKLTDLSGAFQTKIAKNDLTLQKIGQTNIGKQININQQFNLAVHGDVARQLNLNQVVINNGGWANRSYIGPVYGGYTKAAYSAWYAGPGFYPSYCWMPVWSPWVSWTYWDHCLPIYDPRPFWCRPIYWYDPCPPIVVYNYPVWQPLPVVACGTWVDIPPAIVDTGFDVQLLAVRFVDPGHKEQNYGPKYRLWLRNNSRAAIGAPFNVTVVAANGTDLGGEFVQAGLTIPNMDEGAVVPVDIRLPYEANRMNLQTDGYRTPFTHLHVLVDSHRDLQENDEANNGAIIARQDILPVDPAAFSTDVTAAAPGSLVSLAGEGFGPEPGQLLVVVDGRPVQAEIYGWYDLGVNFKLPNIAVTDATPVEVLVVRGDGAASNPVTISVAPQQMLTEAPLPPVPTP
jgi:hypothetical protein